ncbi:MAG: LytTR family DNA-binding domain-containing protein [Bacteroidota bacterium]
MNKLNPSFKLHLLIGLLLGVWGFLFAWFTRPYEHGQMNQQIWINVSVGFSSFAFLCYLLTAWVQNLVYRKLKSWNAYLEVGVYLVFFSIYSISTYFLYKSRLIRGIYDFDEFLIEIIFNLFLVISPLIFISRLYLQKLLPEDEENEHIILKGENKLDFLKIKQAELLCISNAQNYVEIYYLEQGEIRTKLIRTSLKKLQVEFPFLLQIHRSHLINPEHFKSWVDSNTISLNQLELPVSKNYKEGLLSL